MIFVFPQIHTQSHSAPSRLRRTNSCTVNLPYVFPLRSLTFGGSMVIGSALASIILESYALQSAVRQALGPVGEAADGAVIYLSAAR